jgi:hypothetical protein
MCSSKLCHCETEKKMISITAFKVRMNIYHDVIFVSPGQKIVFKTFILPHSKISCYLRDLNVMEDKKNTLSIILQDT